jgi:hypothetical protein
MALIFSNRAMFGPFWSWFAVAVRADEHGHLRTYRLTTCGTGAVTFWSQVGT